MSVPLLLCRFHILLVLAAAVTSSTCLSAETVRKPSTKVSFDIRPVPSWVNATSIRSVFDFLFCGSSARHGSCGSHPVSSRTDFYICGDPCANLPGGSHLDPVRFVFETREGHVSILMPRRESLCRFRTALEFSGRSRPLFPPALCLFGDR